MKVFVQYKNGSPFNINASILEYGFKQRGAEMCSFTVDEIDSKEWNKEDIVVGGVGTYTRIFRKLGIDWKRESYPESLKGFLNREIYNIKLRDLQSYLEFYGKPIFIKPSKDTKEFTGFVVKGPDERWAQCLAGLDGDTDLIGADVVKFTTEYRVYVLEGKIQNVARYSGNVDYHPNMLIVKEMIKDYTDAPIAYGLDVGIIVNGSLHSTALVETNESLALGNYGLPPTLHAKMVASRWFELMGDMNSAQEQAQTIDSPSYINQV